MIHVNRQIEIKNFYPEVELNDIIVKWSNRYLLRYYKKGFKYCTVCNFLIKISERLCRICRNAMRTTIRNKRGWILKNTVPINSPIIIDKINGVII